ncbi:MAG: OprO/OprP family phosphate-selective porin [Oligoflexia bacterium]|nr:OprO/OprP family phosphate-selective porin [Oligoflexia bacterium]
MRNVAMIASLLLLAPAVSHAKSLEDLLVERGVLTKAEAQAASGSSAAKVYWKDGSRFDFPDTGFTAKINTFVQTRYQFTDNDGAPNTSSFSINKARLIVSGTAMNEEFNYYVQGDFIGSANSDGEKVAALKDAYLQWNTCDMTNVRMGQWKTPVSRQYNTSDHAIQFADRTVASDYFDLGRQSGLMGTAKLMDGNLVLAAGIFNGLSDGEGINRGGVDTKHTGTLSARWSAMGKMNPFEEGDYDWTEDAALNIGATYAYSSASSASFGGDFDQQDVSVDANLKYNGWSFHGELYTETQDPDAGEKGEPLGFYTQVGYFFMPKKMEIAARYGLVDCDDGKAAGSVCSGNDKVNQVTVGLNYYWWRHNLKAQLNFDHVNERVLGDADDVNTNKWIFQLSSYF